MSPLPAIRVSRRNPHLLETSDGQPFLLLADTAWELFHRLDLNEIEEYFAIRSEQGFNMVWANLLPEFDGLTAPNRYGDLPLENADPTRPREPYFAFVERVLDLAERHGLYMGLLPAWGDKLTAPWGAGPAIFGLHNLSVCEEYARWLARRLGQFSNIVWVLGGDRPPRVFGEPDRFPMKNALEAGLPRDIDWTPIWRSMAAGLRSGGASHLTTYHPQGGPMSTSVFLHDEPWLDINAMQSGHGGGHDVPVWESIERDYGLLPVKPTLDAEPNYEDHPVSPWPVWDPANGFFDGYDVRKQIYRSIFAGGCGVVYGNHCVWQFASDRYPPVLEVISDWKTALRRPGAESIKHMAHLLLSVDFFSLKPDQSRILGDAGAGGSHARSLSTPSVTLIYVPDGRPIEVDLRWARGEPVSLEEFDPITGATTPLDPPQRSPASRVIPAVSAKPDRVIILRAASG